MDKRVVGLIGVISAGASLGIAHAAEGGATNATNVLRARSFEDLLEPIPIDATLLRAVDAPEAGSARAEPGSDRNPNVQTVQYPYFHPPHIYYPYYPRYYSHPSYCCWYPNDSYYPNHYFYPNYYYPSYTNYPNY